MEERRAEQKKGGSVLSECRERGALGHGRRVGNGRTARRSAREKESGGRVVANNFGQLTMLLNDCYGDPIDFYLCVLGIVK